MILLNINTVYYTKVLFMRSEDGVLCTGIYRSKILMQYYFWSCIYVMLLLVSFFCQLYENTLAMFSAETSHYGRFFSKMESTGVCEKVFLWAHSQSKDTPVIRAVYDNSLCNILFAKSL